MSRSIDIVFIPKINWRNDTLTLLNLGNFFCKIPDLVNITEVDKFDKRCKEGILVRSTKKQTWKNIPKRKHKLTKGPSTKLRNFLAGIRGEILIIKCLALQWCLGTKYGWLMVLYWIVELLTSNWFWKLFLFMKIDKI